LPANVEVKYKRWVFHYAAGGYYRPLDIKNVLAYKPTRVRSTILTVLT